MRPLAFLRTEAASRLLERASAAAGVPLSIHVVERGQEGARIRSWGGCAACRHVAGLEGGKAACRASRGTASAMALRQKRPLPFICHMGFACVAAPAFPDESFVLTFGPYCPAEEARSLESDALAGFEALLGEAPRALPVPLDDIHHAPAEAPPAVAEWTVEALAQLWESVRSGGEATPVEADEDISEAPSHGRRGPVLHTASWAADVAAALISGNQPQARALLDGLLQEHQVRGPRRKNVHRAALLNAVTAVIEALEAAGAPSAPAWNALPRFVQDAAQAGAPEELIDAAMAVLGAVRRKAVPRRQGPAAIPALAKLNVLLTGNLAEGVTLARAAEALGESPSALSHRLKRKFGLNYSEYLGRLRVDKAKDLLRRTRFSATEIARRVGIRDQSHFSKVFKKFTGMTPTEYRNQYGKKK